MIARRWPSLDGCGTGSCFVISFHQVAACSLKQRNASARAVDEIRDWFNRWGEILAWAWRFDGVDEERDLDG